MLEARAPGSSSSTQPHGPRWRLVAAMDTRARLCGGLGTGSGDVLAGEVASAYPRRRSARHRMDTPSRAAAPRPLLSARATACALLRTPVPPFPCRTPSSARLQAEAEADDGRLGRGARRRG
ncbi:hypothetical protein U9M48_005184 [Paspalum notatum var. saurae]|uniref:Uncharacterized protein n=1 Tax=Paspalum notatum var. saurae TaxID=547442 RepID=A0AAQ3SIA2_PASNO